MSIPTEAQTLAALAKLAGSPPAVAPTLILAPGQCAGATGNAIAPSTVITNANHGLAALAAQYGAISLADAPKDTVGNGESWAQANLRDRVLGCFNYAVVAGSDIPPSGPIAGAIARHTIRAGRAAGIALTPVRGIEGLEHNIGHTPRVAAGTDEAKLVAAYLTAIVAREGGYAIVGGYLNNAEDDIRKHFPVQRVIDHAEHLLEETGENYLVNHSLAPPAEVAGACERALRQLIPAELSAASVVPDPIRNDETARQNGIVYLIATVTVLPINVQYIIRAEINV